MKKTYGKANPFEDAMRARCPSHRDVFSDSSHSGSTSDSLELEAPKTRRGGKKKDVSKQPKVLGDISNTQDTALQKKKPKKTAVSKKTVSSKQLGAHPVIPHFDSFDDYDLMVQPVTPIKTHVSISTSTSDGAWDKFPTQELLEEIEREKLHGPVASSPQISLNSLVKACSINLTRLSTDTVPDSCASPPVTRSASKAPTQMPVSMNTRRAKRLRDRLSQSLNKSLSTSTPETKHRKQSRLISPRGQMDLSHIPVMDNVDEGLTESMSHMSMHESLHDSLHESLRNSVSNVHHTASELRESIHQSIHESLQSLHSPPLAGHIDQSDRDIPAIVVLPDISMRSISLLSTNTVSDAGSATNTTTHTSQASSNSALSASLFTASYRDNTALDSILEEPESDDDARIPSVEEVEEAQFTGSVPSLSFSDDEEEHLQPPSTYEMSIVEERLSTCDDIDDENDVILPGSISESREDVSTASSAYNTANSISGSYFTPSTPGGQASCIRESPVSTDISDDRMNALILDLESLKSPSLAELGFKKRERTILRECGQSKVSTWTQYMSASEMRKLTKIGEGTFGEVFRRKTANDDVTILKVVPMEGSHTVNDEPQKKFQEMTKEIRITRELSNIGYNFINTKRIICTQGKYPKALLEKWDDFKKTKVSENDRPDYLPADQYYTVFEFSDGGEALESYNFRSASEGLSVLLQVGWTLAAAEDTCQFEHRDLHWSNILIAQYPEQEITYHFKSTDDEYTISSCGVKAHIIDFTLSRLNKGDEVLFCDLSEDETLFQGVGDYQFDVYRQMRDVTRNEWHKFHSVTNIFWMRYLADKLLKMKSFPSKRGTTPTVTQFKKILLGFIERSKHYHSAVQMVFTDEIFQKYSVASEAGSD